MTKGLGVNKQSNQKSKDLVDGNKGWAPSVGANKKIASRINLPGTPALAGKK